MSGNLHIISRSCSSEINTYETKYWGEVCDECSHFKTKVKISTMVGVGELDVPKQRNLIDKMQPGFHLPLKKTTQQKGMVYYSNMDFSKKNGDARHQPCLIVLKSQNVTRPHPTSNLYKCNSNTNTQQWSRRKQQHDVGAKERQNCPFSDGCRLTHKESTKQQ